MFVELDLKSVIYSWITFKLLLPWKLFLVPLPDPLLLSITITRGDFHSGNFKKAINSLEELGGKPLGFLLFVYLMWFPHPGLLAAPIDISGNTLYLEVMLVSFSHSWWYVVKVYLAEYNQAAEVHPRSEELQVST